MMDAGPLGELQVEGLAKDTALTVGVFDGVHRGHLHLLRTLRERASARGLATGVITLHPHPALVLNPTAGIVYLTSLEERVRLLRASGVDFVLSLTFTPEVAHLSAADFLAALQERLRMRFLLAGPDFALGRGREGGGEALKRLGQDAGFEVESVGRWWKAGWSSARPRFGRRWNRATSRPSTGCWGGRSRLTGRWSPALSEGG